MPQGVLTGFVPEDRQARGHPVGVTIDARGALLVADAVENVVVVRGRCRPVTF